MTDASGSGIEVVRGSDGIVELVLEQPRISLAMLRALDRELPALHVDRALRVVWLRSTGEDFCHGIDLKDPELGALVAAEPGRIELATLGQRVIDWLAELPVPSVVSAPGRVIGGGACLFTACDFRFVGPATRLQFPEVDRGMHLGWGIIPRAIREYGAPAARWLALAGAAIGVADLPSGACHIVDGDVEAFARTFVGELARKPAPAARAIKRSFIAAAAEDQRSATTDPRDFASTVGTPEFMQAMAAWRNRM